MISCNLHDYIEIVCLYRYPVSLQLRSGEVVAGTAVDTDWNIEPLHAQSPDFEKINTIISPNPTSQQCRIEWKQANTATNIQVFDQMGRLVFEKNKVLQNNFTLDVQAFAKGIYMVRLEQKDGIAVEKLVVE